MAVVYMTRLGENGETVTEGICLKCAKELGIKPVNDILDKMGLTPDDIDNMVDGIDGIPGIITTDPADQDQDKDDGTPDGETPPGGAPAIDFGKIFGRFGFPGAAPKDLRRTATRGVRKEGKDPRRKKAVKAQIPPDLLPEPQRKGKERRARLDCRTLPRARTGHPDPLPPPEEQPLPDRRAGRRQDRYSRSTRRTHRRRKYPGEAPRQADLSRRPHRSRRGHSVPRAVRGADARAHKRSARNRAT